MQTILRVVVIVTIFTASGVFCGCDSKREQVMRAQISELEGELSLLKQKFDDYDLRSDESSRKLVKLADRLTIVEKSLRCLEKENDDIQFELDTISRAIKRIDKLEGHLEKLGKDFNNIVVRLNDLENIDADRPKSVVSSEAYEKLVKAHNSLFTAHENLCSEFNNLAKAVQRLNNTVDTLFMYKIISGR